MLLDDVRVALEECADQVQAARLEPRDALLRAQRTVRRRRVARVASALTTLLIVFGAIAVVVANAHSKDLVVVPERPSTTVREPSPPFTPAQLRAHVGADAPAGWSPVDEGDGRVFAPDDWVVEKQGSCIGGSLPGMVSLGQLPTGCETNDPTPADAVALRSFSGTPYGSVIRTVHGYRVYRATPVLTLAGWTRYAVPQLHLEILLRGTKQDRILETLAPSASEVALAYVTRPAPRGHTVRGDGISVTIPSSWTVETPGMLPCGQFGIASTGRPVLLRVRPNAGIPGCPFMIPTVAGALRDGVRLQTEPVDPLDTGTTGRPILELRHGVTTIRVYAEQDRSAAFDVIMQRAGSAASHALYVGLGRDGRVAGGILASLGATS